VLNWNVRLAYQGETGIGTARIPVGDLPLDNIRQAIERTTPDAVAGLKAPALQREWVVTGRST